MYSNNVLLSSRVIIPASMAAVVSLELRQAMYDPEQSCTTDVLKCSTTNAAAAAAAATTTTTTTTWCSLVLLTDLKLL